MWFYFDYGYIGGIGDGVDVVVVKILVVPVWFLKVVHGSDGGSGIGDVLLLVMILVYSSKII